MNFHSANIAKVIQTLNSGPAGLSQEEAKNRFARFGFNEIEEKGRRPAPLIFLKQFHSILIYILIGAAVISFLTRHLLDTYVILGVIALNAIIGFIEEYRAEQAIQNLKKILVSYAKVYRNGALLKIPSSELVPGDVVLLADGDRVPADGRLIEVKNLKVNEAPLTGESFPVEKDEKLIFPESTPFADQKNMIWLGTLVLSGEAKAVVVATGKDTLVGKLAETLVEVKPPQTHFEKQARKLAVQMGVIAILGTLTTFSVGFFVRQLDLLDIFLFSVASLVSSIPEGLPAVLAIVLAIGAHRMAKKNAVIRRLPAVETLGVTTVIVTDKTGTLTENILTANHIILSDGLEISVSGMGLEPTGSFFRGGNIFYPLKNEIFAKLLHIGTVTNGARLLKIDGHYEIIGDPTEAALIVLGGKAGLNQEAVLENEEKIDEWPFDSEKKCRFSLVKHRRKEIYAIGAFEKVMDSSGFYLSDDGPKPLDPAQREVLLRKINQLAEKAVRFLALSYKEVPEEAEEISSDLTRNATLVGFVGMADLPRPEAKDAISRAKRAGLKVVMRTGDHKITAVAVAEEIGLLTRGKDHTKEVFTEEELLKLKPSEFEETVRNAKVLARVTPQMKLRVVETLQKQGEIVAMTGDGTNDAPALKKAHIGIAMGLMGTDVAREAGEMILTDDNFASIVNAIEEGRIAFNNVRHSAFYLVTTNVAEDITIITTLLLGLPLPLLPIHVLWLNLITDGITGSTLAFEPGHNHELFGGPRKQTEKILNKKVFIPLILTVSLMMLGTVLLFLAYIPSGLPKARTVAFTTMALFQLFNVLNMRSLDRSVFTIGFFSNKLVIAALAVSFALQFLVLYIPPIQSAFNFIPLKITDWFLILVLTSTVFWAGELYKLVRNSRARVKLN